MFTVRVIPIARGIFKDSLSFFSRDRIPEGSVISVIVRGRRIPALAVETKDVREEKFDIRAADFSLKKIPSNTKPRRIFSEAFIRAVKDVALWHGVHDGIAMGALTSQIILTSAGRIEEAPPGKREAPTEDEMKARADLLVLQAERGERVRTYRNLAREAFARSASVLIIAPTIIEAETLANELSRGIEDRIILLTGEESSQRRNSSASGTAPSLHPNRCSSSALLSRFRFHAPTSMPSWSSERAPAHTGSWTVPISMCVMPLSVSRVTPEPV